MPIQKQQKKTIILEFREGLAAQGQTSKKYTRPARGSPQRNVGLHTRPYAQALGRRALSNLYMTNPNPDLPPAPYSSIKIPGHEEKTTVPSLQLLVQSFSHEYAQMRSIALLLLLRCNTQTIPLRRVLILTRAPTPTCFGYGLFRSGPSSLPLLVFVDEALGMPQLLLGLPYVMLITLALPLDEVFIAVTNLLVLQHYLNFVAIARFGSA